MQENPEYKQQYMGKVIQKIFVCHRNSGSLLSKKIKFWSTLENLYILGDLLSI